jgi:pyruvate dehydrogenase E1 component
MYEQQENIYYYIAVMNENYTHPDLPAGAEEGILKGMYLLQEAPKKHKLHVQLLGGGTILREVIAAAQLLETDFSIAADIWSVTSFNELRREGLAIERENRMHPEKKAKTAYVTDCLSERKGPVVAATDYMRMYADQIRTFVPGSYTTLGTDGYGRSDTREQLRHFFEVNAKYIAVTALYALAEQGEIEASKVTEAMKKYGIDPKKLDPVIA